MPPCAPVHAAGEFAHDEDVNAVALTLLGERAGVRQNLGQRDWAQVGEQAELFAQAEQGRAFGTFFLGNCRIAIGQTDRAKQD